MNVRRDKCTHCPRAELPGPCSGQNNRRACDRSATEPGYMPPELKPPSFAHQVASFAGAAVKHLFTGAKAPDEIKAIRLMICGGCELNKDGQCQACGCPEKGVELRASWAEQSCPLDPPKWGPVAT